jgi:triacylglycerol lipase
MTDFEFDARTRDYSRLNAYRLGQAALLSYQEAEVVRATATSWGLTECSTFDLRDTQAFIAGNDDLLILAFRGTTDLNDWLTDAGSLLVGGLGGRVHDGFYTALSYVWRDIWDFIRNSRRGRPLWVTGHSLGGALATLMVAKLRLEKDEPVNGLYTFGSPRAGDRDFARRFDVDFESQDFRYVNNADIVTRIPTRAMQFSHVGSFRFFDANGLQRDQVSWWDIVVNRVDAEIRGLTEAQIALIDDHQMTRYLANLERAHSTGSP